MKTHTTHMSQRGALKRRIAAGLSACVLAATLALGAGAGLDPSIFTGELALCTIKGTDAGETVYGKPGDDVICGYGGDDFIYGLGGNDVIYGGDGNDTIDGGYGNNTIYAGNGHDAVWGGPGNDRIHGDAGNDTILGEGGLDIIYGDAGNDTIYQDWKGHSPTPGYVIGGDGQDYCEALYWYYAVDCEDSEYQPLP